MRRFQPFFTFAAYTERLAHPTRCDFEDPICRKELAIAPTPRHTSERIAPQNAQSTQFGGALPNRAMLAIGAAALVLIIVVIINIATPREEPVSESQLGDGYAVDTASVILAAAGSEDQTPVSGTLQLDVPLFCQLPDLPTGCEIVAATMALDYCENIDASPMQLYAYLPKEEFWMTTDSATGDSIGPDPNEVFIGDASSVEGMYCYQGPVAQAIDDYLADHGGGWQAQILNDVPPDDLYRIVRSGTPVVVWDTIEMNSVDNLGTWQTESGETCIIATQYHAMVLVGYDVDDDTVYLNDPATGEVGEYSREEFEASYEVRGERALVVVKA